jgi:hypothetical protein
MRRVGSHPTMTGLVLAIAAFALVVVRCDGRVLEVTNSNYAETIGRAHFATIIYHIDGCEPCHEALRVAEEASSIIEERNIGAMFAKINVSDGANLPKDVDGAPEKLGITTFPTIRIAHFGRFNQQLTRVPRRSADELASFIDVMARPASLELLTADHLVRVLENGRERVPVVVGYYTHIDSQYRLGEMAEMFRGLVQFFHISPGHVETVLHELTSNETLKRRYAAVVRSSTMPRRNTFIIYKQQLRDGVDIFGQRMVKARTELRDRAKQQVRAVKHSGFDPLRADGGDDSASTMPAGRDAPAAAAIQPSSAELRGGGATAWFFSPTVNFIDAFADANHPDEESAEPSLLHGPTFDRQGVLVFLSRHVFPPVDVLTTYNREHINVRTPYVLFFFTSAVSLGVAEEMREEKQAKHHGLHDERSFLMHSQTQLRYVGGRFEAISDEYTNYTYVFAAYEENRQVFHMFGLSLEDYDAGKQNLIAVLRGEEKYVYRGPSAFSAVDVKVWLRRVESGNETQYKRSTPEPPEVGDAGSGALAIVVYDTFNRYVVSNRSRDVFVFFSHEDPRSERALKHFQDIAKAESGNSDVLVAAFDALNNDPPEKFDYDALPAAFYVRRGGSSADVKPIAYDGDFTLRSLAVFAKTHASNPLRNTFAGDTSSSESEGEREDADKKQNTQDRASASYEKQQPIMDENGNVIVDEEKLKTMYGAKQSIKYVRKEGSNTYEAQPVDDGSKPKASGVATHARRT